MRRHCARAASASSVAMKAETTRRLLLPACASALRMKWTRQRCHVALRTFPIVALIPSCASETTSLTPRRPRRASLRRNALPERLSLGRADIHAENLAPAIAVDAHRDDHRDRDDALVLAHLHIGGVDPQIGPIALDRSIEEGLHLVVDVTAQPRHLVFGDPSCPSIAPDRQRSGWRRPGRRLPAPPA